MVCCSSAFTFCAPKPLEDLVTLEEEPHGEEGSTGMLLVVPRAELLQVNITKQSIFTSWASDGEYVISYVNE